MKKAEHQRIDAFELWCWRRLLRVPWTARRSNQSILKEINPGISLEGMKLKLKLQYFGHLMRRVDSLGKTLNWGTRLGEISKRKGRPEVLSSAKVYQVSVCRLSVSMDTHYHPYWYHGLQPLTAANKALSTLSPPPL